MANNTPQEQDGSQQGRLRQEEERFVVPTTTTRVGSDCHGKHCQKLGQHEHCHSNFRKGVIEA
eukprot:scaffold678148_cov55-Prasinocladus_malaysianus.AAC.1